MPFPAQFEEFSQESRSRGGRCLLGQDLSRKRHVRLCSELWKEGLQGILTVPLLLAKVLTRLRGHGDHWFTTFPQW